MKFRPLHDRVVVRRVEEDTKTKGGIIIPDTAQEKPMQGEIIAVGPGGRDESGKLIPIDVKAGDIVLFGKWSGTEVKLDGVEYLIMKESDIMGVIEGKVAVKKAARPTEIAGEEPTTAPVLTQATERKGARGFAAGRGPMEMNRATELPVRPASKSLRKKPKKIKWSEKISKAGTTAAMATRKS